MAINWFSTVAVDKNCFGNIVDIDNYSVRRNRLGANIIILEILQDRTIDDDGSYLVCNGDFTAKTIEDGLPVTNKNIISIVKDFKIKIEQYKVSLKKGL